jgi:hypothetical protein
VGPYQTVQLHPNTTSDTAALTSWLTTNGYSIPSSIDSTIASYVTEGFDFLAVKLVPGVGVQSMRPLSITTPGASVALPLRMVAAGTGSTVGITLWIVGQGRYEPMNFPSFTISPSSIVWDWAASGSNYATLRTQKEASYHNAAWQTESSLDFPPYAVESPVLRDSTASAYVAIPAGDGGAGLTALEAQSKDLTTLFPDGNSMVRITRIRADLSQAALANDLVLQAASDQKTLSNIYQTTLSTNANCPGGGGATSGGTSGGGFGCSSGVCGPVNVLADDGGAGTSSDDGGSATSHEAPTTVHGGCSEAPMRPAGPGTYALLVGLAGVFAWRSRSHKSS